jgi:hypothetical protein
LAVVAGFITWWVVTAANEERGDVTS